MLPYFYNILGVKLIIALCIALIVGTLDVFGLTMFLPALQMVIETEIDPEKLGNLSFLVDGLQKIGLQLSLTTVLLTMVIFFSLKGIAKFFHDAYNINLYKEFVQKIRTKLIDGLNAVSFQYFVTSDVGRIQNTLTGEAYRVTDAYHFYAKALHQGVLVSVYLIFAFLVDWKFALLIAIGGFSSHFLYKLIYDQTVGTSKKVTNYYHQFEGEVIQHVSNYKYLRATGLIQNFGDRLKKSVQDIEESLKKMNVLGALLNAVKEPLLLLIISAIIIIQSQVLGGKLGHLLISLLFFYRAMASLTHLQTAWNSFLSFSGSVENMQTFQQELENNIQPSGTTQLNSFSKQIVVENLYFSYGEQTVLSDISLTINKNESIAFVGKSGSGKTTLVNLITGLLGPTQGKLSIDNVSFENLDTNHFQKRIGYITQEPVVFNDTIYNNVTFWADQTPENMKRFNDVCQKAALAEFIQTLPQKETTLLGNNGINLSGGQKQRIAIARELFKDIDLLIMDEATASLDGETEQLIQHQLESMQGKYTLLIIAHRLSTIKNVDKIVVLENGKIYAIGSYHELATTNDKFKKMITTQSL